MSNLKIDLYNAYRNPDINNFTTMLFRLIMKADPHNRGRISIAYPEEYAYFKVNEDAVFAAYMSDQEKF